MLRSAPVEVDDCGADNNYIAPPPEGHMLKRRRTSTGEYWDRTTTDDEQEEEYDWIPDPTHTHWTPNTTRCQYPEACKATCFQQHPPAKTKPSASGLVISGCNST
ncbi:hypothetical protein AAG570_000189 [Ranatra chinensis]|uniref:Uncharacterized protein n=1 Tax=Ranatra chinensis TaxID=642074 RepID=A0ABD0Z8Z5_9HEMI